MSNKKKDENEQLPLLTTGVNYLDGGWGSNSVSGAEYTHPSQHTTPTQLSFYSPQLTRDHTPSQLSSLSPLQRDTLVTLYNDLHATIQAKSYIATYLARRHPQLLESFETTERTLRQKIRDIMFEPNDTRKD
jgi:hypothetical protein